MTRLRLAPYRDLRRVVEHAGFQWVRREGSHNVFRNDEGRIIVIPDHGSRPIIRPLLRKILKMPASTRTSITAFCKNADHSKAQCLRQKRFVAPVLSALPPTREDS